MKTLASISSNIARLSFIFILLAILSGCYSSASLRKVPQNSDIITRADTASTGKFPAFVSSINVKSNDTSQNTNADFERRFLGHLQKSNYFSDVIYGIYSKRPEPPYVDLSLDVNENLDLNMGGNLTKAFFTGFTLFLLAPVLPATYDFESDFTLHAIHSNGVRRQYEASCAGSAYGTWPYVSAVQKLKESQGNATEKCLNSVINQLTSEKIQGN